jgi:hypothetical protein
MEWNVSLANGSVPSGALLRSLMVIASDDLGGGMSAGDVIGPAPDIIQGWGRPNLSRIIDLQPTTTVHDPSPNVWIHDSFAVDDQMMFADEWLGANNATPIEQVLSKPWNGEGADGPFLSLNESVTWDMPIKEGEDVSIALSFNPRPFGDAVDNLDLVVSFGGYERNSSDLLEATEVVKIDAEDLVGVSSIQVSVVATAVGTAIPGWSGTVGNAGDRLGFALAASGVYRDGVESLYVLDIPSIEDEDVEETKICEGCCGDSLEVQISEVCPTPECALCDEELDNNEKIQDETKNASENGLNRQGSVILVVSGLVVFTLALVLSIAILGDKKRVGVGSKNEDFLDSIISKNDSEE